MSTPFLTDSITTFDEYSKAVLSVASYPGLGTNLLYPALGLAGETGEVCEKISAADLALRLSGAMGKTVEKVKKFYRNEGITMGSQLSVEQQEALAKELGDVLWYVAALAFELGVPLDVIADLNIRKLRDRMARNVIKGEGDNR